MPTCAVDCSLASIVLWLLLSGVYCIGNPKRNMYILLIACSLKGMLLWQGAFI